MNSRILAIFGIATYIVSVVKSPYLTALLSSGAET